MLTIDGVGHISLYDKQNRIKKQTMGKIWLLRVVPTGFFCRSIIIKYNLILSINEFGVPPGKTSLKKQFQTENFSFTIK